MRAIDRLREHNKWRRGVAPYDEDGALMPDGPREVGKVIDEVADCFDEMLAALEKAAVYTSETECAASRSEGDDAFDRDATPLEIEIDAVIAKAKGGGE